jgi:hypothetical protein
METITATEALKLSNKNSPTIETVCQLITNQATSGITKIQFINTPLGFDLIKQIMELGFSITKITNPFGDEVISINW